MNLYTSDQLEEMMRIERTWALNNPSGPLPPLPQPKYAYIDNALRERGNNEYNYPHNKKIHWFIKLFFKT